MGKGKLKAIEKVPVFKYEVLGIKSLAGFTVEIEVTKKKYSAFLSKEGCENKALISEIDSIVDGQMVKSEAIYKEVMLILEDEDEASILIDRVTGSDDDDFDTSGFDANNIEFDF